jgi:hypothetical protein
MFEFDPSIAEELATDTKEVATKANTVPESESSASLEDFADDGTYVPPAPEDESDDDEGEASAEDLDEEEGDEDPYDFHSGAEVATSFIAIGQKTLFTKWIKAKRKSLFTDAEVVRIIKLQEADPDTITGTDAAILAKWQSVQDLIDDTDMPDDVRSAHVTVLEHLLKSSNTKIDPVTIAAFQMAMYYVLKAVEVYSLKPAKAVE